MQNLAEEKETTLHVDVADLSLNADYDRLFQVVVNLVANAIKYSPQGSKVDVIGSSLPGGWLVELKVADNGNGIPAEHLARIFEQFYRVPSQSEEDAQDGTGLGLAICKAIVEAHGGKIGVDSQLGKGSSFWMHLPARINSDEDLDNGTARIVLATRILRLRRLSDLFVATLTS